MNERHLMNLLLVTNYSAGHMTSSSSCPASVYIYISSTALSSF
jgi:hypothetical protein